MKSITVEEITAAVRQLCMDVSYDLPADVERALQAGLEREESSFGQYCLTQILQNCQMARESRQAMCQDTGIVFGSRTRCAYRGRQLDRCCE